MALLSANTPKRRSMVLALWGAALASAAALACLAGSALAPATAFAGELEITVTPDPDGE